jgi:hypothetical protein
MSGRYPRGGPHADRRHHPRHRTRHQRVAPESGGVQAAGKWQAKGSAGFTPERRVPLIADDGSIKAPSRAYGYEAKASVAVTRRLSLNGGLTRISNAFYRGGLTRIYVDSAPHFVANAALTLAGCRGWSGSLRMRAIDGYRPDGEDPSIRAMGHTVSDLESCGSFAAAWS